MEPGWKVDVSWVSWAQGITSGAFWAAYRGVAVGQHWLEFLWGETKETVRDCPFDNAGQPPPSCQRSKQGQGRDPQALTACIS